MLFAFVVVNYALSPAHRVIYLNNLQQGPALWPGTDCLIFVKADANQKYGSFWIDEQKNIINVYDCYMANHVNKTGTCSVGKRDVLPLDTLVLN